MKKEFEVVMRLVEPNSKVIDLACGDGELLKKLSDDKNCIGYGVEKSSEQIVKCVENGVSVLQLDIDEDIENIDKGQFDCVIITNSLQEMRYPEQVIKNSLAIGKYVIISFANIAYWRYRMQLFFKGEMPRDLKNQHWYNTDNISFFSITDFETYCQKNGIIISYMEKLSSEWWENLLAKLLPNLFTAYTIVEVKSNG